MFHPTDLNIIKNITHSVSVTNIEKLKSLSPGIALCFGNAFNIPLFSKIDKPEPLPNSTNVEVNKQWFKTPKEIEDMKVAMNPILNDERNENTIEIFQ